VYGHGFTSELAAAVRAHVRSRDLPSVSVGYRNDWADVQLLDGGPTEFASVMCGAAAIVTNFFHGCVFALLAGVPFLCQPADYRASKVESLLRQLHAESHLPRFGPPCRDWVDEMLSAPIEPHVLDALHAARVASSEFLDVALA
jgi:hypothetical protein